MDDVVAARAVALGIDPTGGECGMGRWCHDLLTLVAVVSMATIARGQCETGKVVPSDGLVSDQFGAAVDLSGGWLIAGAPARDFGVGAAYVYERMGTSWVERALLVPSNPVGFDDFGRSVAITSLYAAVGMPKGDIGPNSDIGLVQVYRWSGTNWILEGFDNQPGVAAFSEFGTSVSLFGDGLLAGAPNSDGVNTTGLGNSGSAYVYRRNASFNRWDLETTFTASDAAELDTFGAAVKLQGNWAFVGAPADKDSNISVSNTVGSVYVFLKQGANWLQVQKLTASDAAAQTSNRQFGRALDCDGNVLIVGERQGQSAYVFRRVGTTWVEEAILKKPAVHSAGSDQFATAVAIEGDLALVGAPVDDDNALSNSGTVFAYRRIGGAWTEQPLIYATDAAVNNRLGVALAIDGTEAAAGALQPGVGTGAIYAMSTGVDSDCNENGIEDACELRLDPMLDGNSNGTFDACECTDDAECNDGLACTGDTCDLVAGRCISTPLPNFCMIAGQCYFADALNPANECEICDPDRSAAMWSADIDGSACGASSACLNGTCQGGNCMFSPAPGVCIIQGECYANGIVNPDNDCERCNPSLSATSWTYRPSGTFCVAPPAVCRGQGTCQSGQCIGSFLASGSPCGDSTSSECNAPDICNGSGSCLVNWMPNGTVCSENGIFCDGVQSCHFGECIGPVVAPCAATPTTPHCSEAQKKCVVCLDDTHCDDLNPCKIHRCNSAGNCSFSVKPNLTPCGDQASSECDKANYCVGGFCSSNFTSNGTECTGNGVFCDGVQACQNGVCTGAVADPCVDTPTRPMCSEMEQACVECLEDEDCSDELSCTIDTCGPTGFCAHTNLPIGSHCGPAVADDCGLRGRCNSFAVCVDSTAQDGTSCAEDGDPCTLDYCDNAACVHRMEALDSPCGLNDCNCNALPDECEIVGGALHDCNDNQIPDECELPFFFATSSRLSPIGLGHVQEFVVPQPPAAIGQVTISLHAISDLFSGSEWIDLFLNGSRVADQLFEVGANDCPPTADIRSVLLEATEFNSLVAGGDARFLLIPSSAVNADLCGAESYVRVEMRYKGADPTDCNANLVPDDCELADGSEADVDPADGRLDSCVPPTCLNQLTSGYTCQVQAGLGESGLAPPSAIVQLELDSICPIGDLRPEHFDVVESKPSEMPPEIVNLSVSESIATVQLSQLPQPLGWTCVSLRGSGKGACVGHFPADVNGDQQANHLDVDELIACCLKGDCAANPAAGCDMDGSGISDSEDVIVLLDFLNGAKSFDLTWEIFHFLSSCPLLCGGPEQVGCQYSYYHCRAKPGACHFEEETIGVCVRPPYGCYPPIIAPVCGCDGGTYSNECEAHQARVSILHDGACQP